MDRKKVMNLIKKNEGPKIDFKQILDLELESNKKELAKDICAIANSKGGRGYLVIGIEDKTKKVIGIGEVEFTEEQIQQIVSSRCEPPIPIALEIINYDNKNIAVISIYDGSQKPYQLKHNGGFYVRRGSTTDTMRKEEIISLFQENLNLNLELCPIIRSDMNCINTSIVDKYFKSQGIAVNDSNRVNLMDNASIIVYDKESNKYRASLGGVLVFSDINNIFIPQNMIRVINRVNKGLMDNVIIKGNLLSMLDKSEQVLTDMLPKNYPIKAVLEGINNAVLYRDYTIYYKDIEVVIDYNSISVISPGVLMNGKNINSSNYLKRNMWIYEKLIALDEKKRFLKSGRGFARMKKYFKSKGRISFINSISDNNFKVIYPGVNLYK